MEKEEEKKEKKGGEGQEMLDRTGIKEKKGRRETRKKSSRKE